VTYDMNFDDVASTYDETRTIPNWVPHKFYEKIFESEIRLNPDLSILDAGIGTGRMAIPLLSFGVHLAGVDISKEMIKRMKEKLRKSSASSQVSLILASVTALPFREHSFDFVLSVHVLHLIDGWREAITETKRVLRTDGLFSIVGNIAPELISKTGKKYFELCKNYSAPGLSGRSIWILNKVLKYEKTGFLEHILKRFAGGNNFWGSKGQAYLKKQAFSMEKYVIEWQEVINTDEMFNHFQERIVSDQWRIPLEIHQKAMSELSKWKNEEIRKNGPSEKMSREFKATMVRFR
jgi:ubiquinone/menaquinone biosynthesis C-methylase UbiE